MNWQIFGLALLFGLLAFPVMTKQSSMAHKYAVVATQIVAGYFSGSVCAGAANRAGWRVSGMQTSG